MSNKSRTYKIFLRKIITKYEIFIDNDNISPKHVIMEKIVNECISSSQLQSTTVKTP